MNAIQFTRNLFYSQFMITPPLPTASFANQTIIVTGSNTGIGYEAVKHFIRLDAAKIIIAVRSPLKGEAAAQKILEETGCNPSRLEVWEFDLASFESIRTFVAKASKLERLDVVVQNAGIIPPKEWTFHEDGTEMTLKVNTFGAVYFAYAILPKLRASAEKTGSMGRLSLNGSDSMFLSSLLDVELSHSLVDAMNNPAQSTTFGDRYALTKALLFYTMRILASQSPLATGSRSNVLINVVTPGATKSEIFSREEKRWYEIPFLGLLNFVARETEVGARTLVHAVEPDISPVAHGQFLMNSAIMMENPMLANEKVEGFQKKWEKEFLPLLENIHAGVTRV